MSFMQSFRLALQSILSSKVRALLTMLGSYADAEQLVGQCYYALAEAELSAGQYEAAGEWFLLAGAYALCLQGS